MLNSQRFILYLKGLTTILVPNLNPNFPNFLSTNSHYYSKITSNQNSFTVSYLINNCGFSHETALTASKLVHFQTAQKPDSVITFFRNHGFNKSQLYSIIRKSPNVLTCDPHERVLSKFEFLYSKGASSSDIVLLVTRDTRFLYTSLENSIIPSG
ncbi:putative transcription regulator mTERF family [Lupinus albus]|uniref:Putative transcription regulator mTERF family n=1 Tax=Lupinus albus TaxID=3870 RepID=A0A6A4Q3M4_LUPAL|nr:putative transcription regulator mTERF family [Lupinus albus]